MVAFSPFSALRANADLVAQIAAVPYDVVDTDEARALVDGNPKSFLRISRSEVDLPVGTNPYSDDVYRTARTNLLSFVKNGWLINDPSPSFFIYRLAKGNHEQNGVVGCSSVEDYDRGVIKIHELTRADKEADRTRHILETGMHSGPVFLTYRTNNAICGLVDEEKKAPPIYDFSATDGVRHTIWKCSNNNNLASAFSEIPATYVADGHHRAKSASLARATLAEDPLRFSKAACADVFLSVLFPHQELRILPYNRVIDFLPCSASDLLTQIQQHFTVDKTDDGAPSAAGEIRLFLNSEWYRLRLKHMPDDNFDPVQALDVSALQELILEPIFGIKDQRTDKRIDFVGGIKGPEELERRVRAGSAAVAFSLYPVSIEQLLTVADAGLMMPPKSTWFEPKLRSGLLVHRFQE